MTDPAAGLARLTHDERLHPWGPGIHLATGTTRFLGVPIWNTCAVIELERPGELLVWNPSALTPALRASLDELGQRTGRRVAKLLAGLDYHHRYLGDWQAAFPDADTFLVSERIRDQRPGVAGRVLEGDHPVVPGAEADVELLSVRGCLQPWFERSARWRDTPRREWFVLHRPSRSLLVGDMLLLNDRVGPAERLIGMRVGFTFNGTGFRTVDRAERSAFLREVLAREVERAVTAHGKASATGGEVIRRELEALFRL